MTLDPKAQRFLEQLAAQAAARVPSQRWPRCPPNRFAAC